MGRGESRKGKVGVGDWCWEEVVRCREERGEDRESVSVRVYVKDEE